MTIIKILIWVQFVFIRLILSFRHISSWPGPRTMTYISTGDFSERPYFSDFGQVWEYVQKNGQIV